MELFPDFQLGLANGWIPLVIFYVIYGIVLRSLPQQTRAWLYDRKGWRKSQRIMASLGLPFALVGMVLLVLTPLKPEGPIFTIGLVGYGLATLAFVKSLYDFNNSPPDEPATEGLYQWSRNPQWVSFVVLILSMAMMVGSWVIAGLFTARVVLNHFRILGEEKACLEVYGDAYQAYMQEVPRYGLGL
jgi:protein-S-isoprenylcysteine O-methyltransferase Ste14